MKATSRPGAPMRFIAVAIPVQSVDAMRVICSTAGSNTRVLMLKVRRWYVDAKWSEGCGLALVASSDVLNIECCCTRAHAMTQLQPIILLSCVEHTDMACSVYLRAGQTLLRNESLSGADAKANSSHRKHDGVN